MQTAQELKDYFRTTLVAPRNVAQEFLALDALVDFANQNDNTNIPDWTGSLTFQLDGSDDGAFCTEPDTNGRIRFFKTKVNNNTNNTPPTDPLITENAYWIEVSPGDGSAVKEWAPGVYGDGLIIVYFDTSGTGADPDLYVLAEATRPFHSTNFTTELAAGKWKRMQTVFDVAATGGTDVMNIGTTNADVINIGRVGATVNIYGNTIYSQVTNLEVSDKLIRLNRGGAAASAGGSGFELEENAVVTGYVKTSTDRNSYELKVPNVAHKASFSFASLSADRSYTLPNNSGTLALLSDISGGTSWSLASGGTLTGNNAITGTGFTLKGIWTALGTTQTDGYGWWLQNTTAAAAGAQQVSPSIVLEGQGWKTTATAASQPVQTKMYVIPVQGTTTPFGALAIEQWSNGVSQGNAWFYRGGLNFTNNSDVTIAGIGFGNGSGPTARGSASIYHSGSGLVLTSATGPVTIPSTSNDFVIGSLTTNARFYVVQNAMSSGWKPAIRIDPGAHTSMTAAAEFIANDYSGATWTWLAGTIARQRFTIFRAFTVATGTVTHGYGVYIESPLGTVTNSWALGVDGNIQLGNSNVSGTARLIEAASSSTNCDLTFKNQGSGTFNFNTTSGNATLVPAGSATAFNLRGVGTTPSIILAGSSSNSGLNITSITPSSGDIEMIPSAVGTYFISIKGSAPASSAGGNVSLLGGSPSGGNNNGGDATIGSGIPSGSGAEGNVNIQNRANGKLGFFNVTPVVRQAGLTAFTHTAPGTPDYAIQDLTNAGGFGFATKDEGNTVLSIIKAMHDAMKAYGLLT